ncbi:hypothetical protein BDZ94DRAFT_865337 [Collybia nuda]|uniref:Uncharacterized protein n=1 Tax=Collybia nuda TaxID=64659 RepID=A0A9P5Y0E3_9AGAR|nr:hypothetical protein BDZ94DRAFT_865337 [Collybia nuda]
MTALKSPAAVPFPMAPAWSNPKEDLSTRSKSIKQLINDALEVQDGLNTVKNMLAQLQPDETASKLVVAALSCQDKFFNLLAASRDSASILMAHMEDFTQNIMPLVQDETVSLSDKLIEVKGSAELISSTAHQSPRKLQKQLEDLKTELDGLEGRIGEWTQVLETNAQEPMRELSENIRELESQLTAACV